MCHVRLSDLTLSFLDTKRRNSTAKRRRSRAWAPCCTRYALNVPCAPTRLDFEFPRNKTTKFYGEEAALSREGPLLYEVRSKSALRAYAIGL